jgi:magnesium transporter
MDAPVLDDILARMRVSLEHDDLTGAVSILESLRPADQAEVFSELDDEDQAALLPKLNPADSADILEELDDEEAAELVATLSTDTVIRIVDEMEPDEAADLLGDIGHERAQQVLAGLEDPDEVRPLLLHSDDSAGGLMTSEFLVLKRRMTTGEALQAIRSWHPEAETIYYLFVVDRFGRLCGVVNLRQLVVADPATPIGAIMNTDLISVRAGADQEECARLMSRYDLLALPVVDYDNTLLGVITIDDVVEVLEEETTEDIQRLGGAEPLNRPYLDTSIWTMTRKRFGWLLLLFVTGTLTGSVMRLFENELETVVTLTFFVPLLIGTGGNAGSQTTATIIRALAVGDLDFDDALLALWHEMRTAILLGGAMAVAAYIRAITWGTSQALAITVSLAIFVIVCWANGIGSVLPLLAARLGVDPTVVSGPLMSTLVDATGLFIYFSMARFILHL